MTWEILFKTEVMGSEVQGSEVQGSEVQGSEVQGSEVQRFRVQRLYGIDIHHFNSDYAVAEFAEDVRRRVRRRTLVLQAPDNKADSVKSATLCGFKCRKKYIKNQLHLLG